MQHALSFHSRGAEPGTSTAVARRPPVLPVLSSSRDFRGVPPERAYAIWRKRLPVPPLLAQHEGRLHVPAQPEQRLRQPRERVKAQVELVNVERPEGFS